jgi:excisionase family DNA binding protein
MKPALASTAATTLLDRDRIARLEEMVAELADRDEAREAENIVLRVRVGMLEATQPAPRFEIPADWITVQQAASRCGAGRSTISRWCDRGKIVSATYGGRTFIDPDSLRRWAVRS